MKRLTGIDAVLRRKGRCTSEQSLSVSCCIVRQLRTIGLIEWVAANYFMTVDKKLTPERVLLDVTAGIAICVSR